MTSQERIIRSAIALFGERGYESTSLKDIGADAGHAAGLITHHFKTKAALFLTCGLNVLDELSDEIAAGIDESSNGLESVLDFARVFMGYATERRSSYLVLVKLSPFSVSRPELSSEELVWKLKALLQLLNRALKKGLEDGSIKPLHFQGGAGEVDVETYGLTVFSTLMGTARTLAISPFAHPSQLEATLAFLHGSLQGCTADATMQEGQ